MSRYKTILPFLETPESKEIFRLFVKPLFRYKEQDSTYQKFMEDVIFNLPTRAIFHFRATTDFHMPGLWFISPTSKIQTMGPREVKKGDLLYVRYDQTIKDEVQIEIEDGNVPYGTSRGVFALTDDQYFDLSNYMEMLTPLGLEHGGYDS